MGAVVAIGDSHKVEGLFGPMFMEFDGYYSEFNRSYVWVTDNTLAGYRINNTYTGVLRQLQMNLSDAMLIPSERSPEAGVVEFGEVLTTSPVVMVFPLTVSPYPDTILTQLFRFSTDIVCLLLIMTFVFALVLKKSEGVRSSAFGIWSGMWHMMQMMLNQVQVSPVTISGRLLVLWTMMGVFFWLLTWQNQMTMEMIAFDTSKVIRTVSEADFTNKTPVMTRTEASTMQVEEKAAHDPDSTLGRLMTRAEFNNEPVDPATVANGLTQSVLNKHVLVVSTRLLSYMEASYCAAFKNQNPKFDFLLGKEAIVDIFVGPWFNPSLNARSKNMLRKKSTKIRDHGLGIHINDFVDREVRAMTEILLVGQDFGCLHRSVEAFIDKEFDHQFSVMTLDKMSDVFLLLSCAVLGSMFVLLLEKSTLIDAACKEYRALFHKAYATRVHRNVWQAKRRHFPMPFIHKLY